MPIFWIRAANSFSVFLKNSARQSVAKMTVTKMYLKLTEQIRGYFIANVMMLMISAEGINT